MRLLVLAAILFIGCGRHERDLVRTVDGNPADVSSVPEEFRGEALATIASATRGRLPGVRFWVLPHPVTNFASDKATKLTSYRINGPKALIVLSWRMDPTRGFVVEDAPWEVEHLVAGTDDHGDKLPVTWRGRSTWTP